MYICFSKNDQVIVVICVCSSNVNGQLCLKTEQIFQQNSYNQICTNSAFSSSSVILWPQPHMISVLGLGCRSADCNLLITPYSKNLP